MKKAKFLFFCLTYFIAFAANAQKFKTLDNRGKVWSAEKANQWYKEQKWITGANYIPANAINQLEMWQADSFDTLTIDKELALAEGLGFNTLRVFLHSMAYRQDPAGFKDRITRFLNLTSQHNIKPMLVFFDDCWNKTAKIGKQPAPKPGVHNSGWLQDPGDPAYKDPVRIAELEVYVRDILFSFRQDKRILMWDLYNEPGNQGKREAVLPLVKKVSAWARAINPEQPITIGLWSWGQAALNQFQVANSDIITYHNYGDANEHLKLVQVLKSFGKPLICTEYMARTHNSKFSNIMPMLNKENVGAINWGLVAGKSNTKYSWEETISDGGEPNEWFHDIFRPDGSPYRQDEVNLIRKLNGLK